MAARQARESHRGPERGTEPSPCWGGIAVAVRGCWLVRRGPLVDRLRIASFVLLPRLRVALDMFSWHRKPSPAAASAIPARIARVAIISGQCRPLRAAQTVQIIDDFAVLQCHLARQPLHAFQ